VYGIFAPGALPGDGLAEEVNFLGVGEILPPGGFPGDGLDSCLDFGSWFIRVLHLVASKNQPQK
jgi:hypothetical protein